MKKLRLMENMEINIRSAFVPRHLCPTSSKMAWTYMFKEGMENIIDIVIGAKKKTTDEEIIGPFTVYRGIGQVITREDIKSIIDTAIEQGAKPTDEWWRNFFNDVAKKIEKNNAEHDKQRHHITKLLQIKIENFLDRVYNYADRGEVGSVSITIKGGQYVSDNHPSVVEWNINDLIEETRDAVLGETND